MNTDFRNMEIDKEKKEEVIKLLKERVLMLESLHESGGNSQDIDLIRVWRALAKGKYVILSFSLVFIIISSFVAYILPNEYRATAILSPAASSSNSQFSALAGQFGGLASLAGVDLGGLGGDDKSSVAVELMSTWGFIESFIEDNAIQAEVFAAKSWSKTNNNLSYDEDIYESITGEWVRDFEPKKLETPYPTSWELYEKFSKRLNIIHDPQTGLVRVSIEHYSPFLAKTWVDQYVKSVNHHFQAKERNVTIERIAYLERQIQETNVAEMQNIFYQLIEEQTKTLMLAEVSDEYVFRTVSEAKIAEEEIRPKRLYMVALGAISGGLMSSLFIVFLYYRRV